MKTLEIKTALQIQKPAHEVFEAIVDPEKMRNYFISKGSGRMEEGANLVWNFTEMVLEAPVHVGKVVQDKYISFSWQGDTGNDLFAEITLEPQKDGSTVVRITEKGMENNEAGIAWLIGNTDGWANFLASLKAYLEYGINLRKGAFDFMKL